MVKLAAAVPIGFDEDDGVISWRGKVRVCDGESFLDFVDVEVGFAVTNNVVCHGSGASVS